MCMTHSLCIFFPFVFQKFIQAYQPSSAVVVTGATLDVLCVHSVVLVFLHLRRGWLVGLQGGVHLTDHGNSPLHASSSLTVDSIIRVFDIELYC